MAHQLSDWGTSAQWRHCRCSKMHASSSKHLEEWMLSPSAWILKMPSRLCPLVWHYGRLLAAFASTVPLHHAVSRLQTTSAGLPLYPSCMQNKMQQQLPSWVGCTMPSKLLTRSQRRCASSSMVQAQVGLALLACSCTQVFSIFLCVIAWGSWIATVSSV